LFGEDQFFKKKKNEIFICGVLIFQEKVCKRFKKPFFFRNLTSSIFEFSYAFSTVKKYLKLAFLIQKEICVRNIGKTTTSLQ
jgi:hypothetical protein